MGIVRIYFFSCLSFFLPLSGMDGWVTCGLSPFQQNFSDIRTLGDEWLYAMKSRLRLRRSPPQAGLESGAARSAGHRLTELPGDGRRLDID